MNIRPLLVVMLIVMLVVCSCAAVGAERKPDSLVESHAATVLAGSLQAFASLCDAERWLTASTEAPAP